MTYAISRPANYRGLFNLPLSHSKSSSLKRVRPEDLEWSSDKTSRVNDLLDSDLIKHLSKHLSALSELGELSDDWDGQHTLAPTKEAISGALSVLMALAKNAYLPESVIASAEGGVGFGFVKELKQADIEIFNDGEILAAIYPADSLTEVWPVELVELSSTIKRISAFLG